MRPSVNLLWLLTAWCGLAFVVATLKILGVDAVLFKQLWLAAGGIVLLLALVDAVRGRAQDRLNIIRDLPHSLALGIETEATLTIVNNLSKEQTVELTEAPCDKINHQGLPLRFQLKPRETKNGQYTLVPISRGEATLDACVVRIDSPWHLWQYKDFAGTPNLVKIYPNFAPITQFAQLRIEEHVRQMGAHLVQRRGEGMEFKQLRDFVEGDAIRQIDWKATARYRRPISREYEDERNQDVFFLLDCGRRLRHKESDLSHFDHALNAILLTAYTAMRQGDGAGFSSFSGELRWLAPIKGANSISTFMEMLYDLDSTLENTDFVLAAQDFISRHNRRSLIVLVSNIRPEDQDDLVSATKLLSKNHLVMVANLRERLLDETIATPVQGFSSALNYCGSHQLIAERNLLKQQLTARGVLFFDTLPEHLHINLVNEYFKVKRSGRL